MQRLVQKPAVAVMPLCKPGPEAFKILADPLLFLALELVPDHRQIVTERSAGWRSPIRTRWKDCVTLVDRWADRQSRWRR